MWRPIWMITHRRRLTTNSLTQLGAPPARSSVRHCCNSVPPNTTPAIRPTSKNSPPAKVKPPSRGDSDLVVPAPPTGDTPVIPPGAVPQKQQ